GQRNPRRIMMPWVRVKGCPVEGIMKCGSPLAARQEPRPPMGAVLLIGRRVTYFAEWVGANFLPLGNTASGISSGPSA
ncbi:MAG: hypothetical protein NT069_33890, partial [Planctomycetota bacterium]|nr:hypothetical protein [Planctomycetota bacterium]